MFKKNLTPPVCNRVKTVSLHITFYKLNSAIPVVPITFLYGSDSWIARLGAEEDDKQIPGSSLPHSTVEIIEGAGHHVYADMPHLFNSAVRKALK